MNLGGAGSLGCLNWAWWLSFCFWVLRTSIFSSGPFPFFLSSYKITIYNSYCIWNGNFGGLTKKHMELEQKPRWKVTIYHQQQGFNTWILDFKIEKVDFPWKSWEFGFSPIKKMDFDHLDHFDHFRRRFSPKSIHWINNFGGRFNFQHPGAMRGETRRSGVPRRWSSASVPWAEARCVKNMAPRKLIDYHGNNH